MLMASIVNRKSSYNPPSPGGRELTPRKIFDFSGALGSRQNQRFWWVQEEGGIHLHPNPLPSRQKNIGVDNVSNSIRTYAGYYSRKRQSGWTIPGWIPL
jgi:hypothetical protein